MYDQLVVAERLHLLSEIEQVLAATGFASVAVTLAELDAAVVRLEDYRRRIDLMQEAGNARIFAVSKRLTDVIAGLKQQRFLLASRAVKRKTTYTKGNSTLRFLAEDELNDGQQWPRFLVPNGIRYSTDLLNIATVNIP